MDNNFYDYIEIGTSDFDMLIEKEKEKKGVSIEPVKYYYNKLPNNNNVKKLNFAVSDVDGKCKVFYIPDEIIKKYNLPDWIKGCNSINSYHKLQLGYCKNKNLNPCDVIKYDEIPVKTLYNIYCENNIQGVYYLKIDTEGHDYIILTKFIDDVRDNNFLLPHKILFESNNLTKEENINKTIDLYSTFGYDLISKDQYNTLLKLNLQKIKNKNKFTKGIRNYYLEKIYPNNYDKNNPPHENTLESAMNYCIKYDLCGITYNDNKYTVYSGKYIDYIENNNIITWLYL